MSWWELADLSTPWAVMVASTLGVPEQVEKGNGEIAKLAAACGSDRVSLLQVMRHLASRGVFEEPQPGVFAMNDTARELLDPGAKFGLNIDGFGGRMARVWETMISAVRTGKPAYHERFGRPYWEDLDAHPEIAEQFDALMGPGHGTPDPEVLLNPADWSSVKTVVDIGGGTGSLLAEVLKARPHVRGILVDLPRAIARSRAVFEAAGVADRVTTSAQSFFDPLPTGGDVYMLSRVLADWPDAEAIALLKRCAEAARQSNGRVVLLSGVTLDDKPHAELLMLVLVGGRSRTLTEFREMARKAGLEVRASGGKVPERLVVETTASCPNDSATALCD